MLRRVLISFVILGVLAGAYLYSLLSIPPPEQLAGKIYPCSVVAIGSRFSPDEPHHGYGTGFVISQNTVITASHVAKTDFLDVKICGVWRRGELIKRSPRKLVRTDLFTDGLAVTSYYHGFGEFALIRVNTYGSQHMQLAEGVGVVDKTCRWYIFNCSSIFKGLILKTSGEPRELISPPEYLFGFFHSSITRVFAENLEIRGITPFGSSGSPILNNKGLAIGMVNGVRQDLSIVYGLSSSEIKDFMDDKSNLWNTLKE